MDSIAQQAPTRKVAIGEVLGPEVDRARHAHRGGLPGWLRLGPV